MGVVVNIVLAKVYSGGFRSYVAYKDELNWATEDTVELSHSEKESIFTF